MNLYINLVFVVILGTAIILSSNEQAAQITDLKKEIQMLQKENNDHKIEIDFSSLSNC